MAIFISKNGRVILMVYLQKKVVLLCKSICKLTTILRLAMREHPCSQCVVLANGFAQY